MPSILVVEDDENLNRGITFSLKKSGYEVFSAESVKKAKRIASDNNVDVTICDVNLPDGNGVCFRKFFGELSVESRVRLSVRTLFVTPGHTASFPLRVSMARSLLMAAEDGFCKTACFE